MMAQGKSYNNLTEKNVTTHSEINNLTLNDINKITDINSQRVTPISNLNHNSGEQSMQDYRASPSFNKQEFKINSLERCIEQRNIDLSSQINKDTLWKEKESSQCKTDHRSNHTHSSQETSVLIHERPPENNEDIIQYFPPKSQITTRVSETEKNIAKITTLHNCTQFIKHQFGSEERKDTSNINSTLSTTILKQNQNLAVEENESHRSYPLKAEGIQHNPKISDTDAHHDTSITPKQQMNCDTQKTNDANRTWTKDNNKITTLENKIQTTPRQGNESLNQQDCSEIIPRTCNTSLNTLKDQESLERNNIFADISNSKDIQGHYFINRLIVDNSRDVIIGPSVTANTVTIQGLETIKSTFLGPPSAEELLNSETLTHNLRIRTDFVLCMAYGVTFLLLISLIVIWLID